MRELEKPYEFNQVLKCVFGMVCLGVLMRAIGGGAFLIVIPLMLVAYIRNDAVALFYWMLVGVAAIILNKNFFPKDMLFGIAHRGLFVLFGVLTAGRVFGGKKEAVVRPFLLIGLYLVFMLIPSTFGWNRTVSYLKLFLFSAVYFAYLGIVMRVTALNISISRLRSVLLSFAVVFIMGSILLIPFPGLSNFKPLASDAGYQFVSLFMGMTSQPQCLGPVVSGLSVFLLSDMLFGVKRPEKLYILLLVCCPILIYKTSSRTAMASYILGMAYVLFLFLKSQNIGRRWKGKILSAAMLLIAAGGIAVLSSSGLSEDAKRFALKAAESNGEAVTFERVTASRQGLVEESLRNFKEKPLIGNGFQVSETMQYGTRSLLSAPIEKGFWPTAILEEGGIIGFVLFAAFLLICIITTARYEAHIASSLLTVSTFVNCGEFVFFSMSYSGGFLWAMVFAGLLLDLAEKKRRRLMRFPVDTTRRWR